MTRYLATALRSAISMMLFATAASAQNLDLDKARSSQVIQQQGLQLTLEYEGRMVLGEPIVVIAFVENAGTNPITVQQVTISGSGLLSRLYTSCSVRFNEQTVAPEQSVAGTCTLKEQPLPISALLYGASAYKLRADIKIAVRADSIPILVEAKMAMPESSVVYGALVGVVLLVLFTSSHLYLRALPQPPANLAALKAGMGDYLLRLPIRLVLGSIEIGLRAVQGAVVAVILIVLARSMTELDAPITVRVDDFWGGLLVGIFSVTLSNWLAEKLGVPDRQMSERSLAKDVE